MWTISDHGIRSFVESVRKNFDLHTIFVVEEAGEIIGVGHISKNDTDLEFAFSVSTEYQGTGVGSALMQQCIDWGSNRGYSTAHITCLAGNTPMIRLVKKYDATLHTESGEVTGRISVPVASIKSVGCEFSNKLFFAIADQLTQTTDLAKLPFRVLRLA
jgi:GNAT superfamily N-acetyltransferase